MRIHAPVDRTPQIVTSPFGRRWLLGRWKQHNGVDLRSYDDELSERKNIIMIEDAIYVKKAHEVKWGWTAFFQSLRDREMFYQYTHITKPPLIEGDTVHGGEVLGQTAVTDYMRRKRLGEHLHFGVFFGPLYPKRKRNYIDPVDLFRLHDIPCGRFEDEKYIPIVGGGPA